MNPTPIEPPPAQVSAADEPLAKAIKLMRILHENSARLLELEGRMNREVSTVLSTYGADAAMLEILIADAEHELEILCRAHPEWFAKLKRIKTPFGNFQMQKTTHLEIPDQEATVRRIRRNGLGKALLRLRLEIRIEACELLDDTALEKLGIARKTEESFSAKPLKIEAGKAAATIKKNAADGEEDAS